MQANTYRCVYVCVCLCVCVCVCVHAKRDIIYPGLFVPGNAGK